MTVQKGLRCGACNDTVYSNSRHDWERCECGAVFIDGGFDYHRWGGTGWEWVEREVDRATLPHYYDDERRGLSSPS